MFNPHPPLSSFPIVLMTLTFAAELLSLVFKEHQQSLRRFATTLLAICGLISPLTYFSGYWGAEFAEKGSVPVLPEIIATHQAFAKAFIFSLVPCILFSIIREKAPRGKLLLQIFFSVFLLISCGLVLYASFLGGELVFKHGAAVNLSPLQ